MVETTHPGERDGRAPGAYRAGAAPRGRALSSVSVVLAYAFAVAAFLIGRHLMSGADYVGHDNDDVMRLVEVRDFLAGQGWFDMHQYRLGVEGGTLMHWSRLVDLPIAALIVFFSLFLDRTAAEAAALIVWPTLTLVPLMAGMGLAGARLGGRTAMHAALGLTGLYVICINRFQPGAIDHHNVQLALMALIAAMICDPAWRVRSLAIAGTLAAAAVAVGAETTPQVAALCGLVALVWAWQGEPASRATRAFSLSFAATLAGLFHLLIPPARYSMVTCDALSMGFYVLGAAGGGLLFGATTVRLHYGRTGRFAVLGLSGAALAGLAVLVAPQCLRGPLANLDPLLVRLWLDNISEAQSVVSMLRAEPFSAGAFYAVPLLAIAVCLVRVGRGDRIRQHLALLALLVVSFGVTLVQVRGSIFATIFAFVPLAAAVADLRARYVADQKNIKTAAAFVGLTVATVPPVWAFGGGLLALAFAADAPPAARVKHCSSKEALAPLAQQPAGVVSAPSDMGVDILRYTDHRVLSAPYHRNQAGMLAELAIAMAAPADAEAKLRAAGVTLLAYCPSEPETKVVERESPAGLYAALGRGDVPSYLEKLPGSAAEELDLYRVVPAR